MITHIITGGFHFSHCCSQRVGVLHLEVRSLRTYSRFQNGCHTGLGCRGARSSACGRSQDTEVQRYDRFVRWRFATVMDVALILPEWCWRSYLDESELTTIEARRSRTGISRTRIGCPRLFAQALGTSPTSFAACCLLKKRNWPNGWLVPFGLLLEGSSAAHPWLVDVRR